MHTPSAVAESTTSPWRSSFRAYLISSGVRSLEALFMLGAASPRTSTTCIPGRQLDTIPMGDGGMVTPSSSPIFLSEQQPFCHAFLPSC